MQVLLRNPIFTKVLLRVVELLNNKTPAETNLDVTTEHGRGFIFASVLADVIKQWLRDTAVSVNLQSVVEALGPPFTDIGQHHCAAEALGRMLQLLDAGINEYFPEVSCWIKGQSVHKPKLQKQRKIQSSPTQSMLAFMLQCHFEFATAFGFAIKKFEIVAGTYKEVPNMVDHSKVLILGITEGMCRVEDALDFKFLGSKTSDSPREVYRVSHLPDVMFLALDRAQVRLSFTTTSSCPLLPGCAADPK